MLLLFMLLLCTNLPVQLETLNPLSENPFTDNSIRQDSSYIAFYTFFSSFIHIVIFVFYTTTYSPKTPWKKSLGPNKQMFYKALIYSFISQGK